VFEYDTFSVTSLFTTHLQLRWHALCNLLCQVISIGRMCFIHLAFDIAQKKLIWCWKIRQAAGPVDTPEMRNVSPWKHLPHNWHGNPCWVSSCTIMSKPQRVKLKKINLFCRNVSSMAVYYSALIQLSHLIIREMGTNNAIGRSSTPHFHFRIVQERLLSSHGLFVYSHNLLFGSWVSPDISN
jgi:hypothetical protein